MILIPEILYPKHRKLHSSRRLALLPAFARMSPASASVDGRVAQLGERLVRNEEVRGSSPLTSTKFPRGGSGRIHAHDFNAVPYAAVHPLNCLIRTPNLKQLQQSIDDSG